MIFVKGGKSAISEKSLGAPLFSARTCPLTSPAIQDLHGAVNHDQNNLWNAVLLPHFEVNGQNYGSLALRNAWSYVWFALDNYYYQVCGSVRQPAPVPPGSVCLINAIWLQTWGVRP